MKRTVIFLAIAILFVSVFFFSMAFVKGVQNDESALAGNPMAKTANFANKVK